MQHHDVTRGGVVGVVVLLLVGCGTRSKDKFDDLLVEMDGIADHMCACKDSDAACRTKVHEELLAFRKGMKDKVGKDKASAAQDKLGRQVEDKLRACRNRGTAAGFEDVLTQLTDSTTKMCACPDQACAAQVRDGWKAQLATMHEQLGSAATPSDEQDARGKVIDAEMKACLAKFEPAETTPR